MPKRALITILLILIAANVFVWSPIIVVRHPLSNSGAGEVMTVAFLNVGQGDAIYIETPSGRQVLIDGGPDKSVLRELGQVMPFYDRSLDLVIVTHEDSDHIGGLPDTLERFSVKSVVGTTNDSDSKLAASFEQIAQERGDREVTVHAGERIILDTNIYLDILSPAGDPEKQETNKASLVAKLTYASTSFLLTGDVDESVEKYLVKKYGALLASDVIKISHHGSRNSNDPAFLKAASSTYAVISVAADNRFGHPHEEVLDTLSNLREKVLRTDQLGTIIFKSDGVLTSLQ